ncbi:MAG: hypothetical protein N3G76_01195 [Candidatus Micrarchaeota archaeon]|nr:hypothetical protein [Candidatus Micrarchaeota archaeon]
MKSIKEGMHTCIKCGAEYNSWDFVTMRACTKCNGTSFVFKAKDADAFRHMIAESSDVKVIDRGIFELNIGSLAQHDPIVIEGDDGVFFIKFPKKK